jgi:hypothetical protein
MANGSPCNQASRFNPTMVLMSTEFTNISVYQIRSCIYATEGYGGGEMETLNWPFE